MTAMRETSPELAGPTVAWPNRLLTLAEWDELPAEGVYRRAELDEGVVVLAPTPTGPHQRVAQRLAHVLDAALPVSLTAVEAIDVELVELPATVRQSDVLVIPEEVFQTGRHRYVNADLLLAVEIVSPGSRSRDRVLKLHQYGAAGIPCYWLIDLEREPSLVVCSDPRPSGGYATTVEYRRDEEVALALPDVDAPIRFSVAGLLRR